MQFQCWPTSLFMAVRVSLLLVVYRNLARHASSIWKLWKRQEDHLRSSCSFCKCFLHTSSLPQKGYMIGVKLYYVDTQILMSWKSLSINIPLPKPYPNLNIMKMFWVLVYPYSNLDIVKMFWVLLYPYSNLNIVKMFAYQYPLLKP
jgi:hypothetical protein